MSHVWSLRRTMLQTLIAALALGALVGIWTFIFGSFSTTEVKILLTTLSVAFFSVTALGASVAQQLKRSRLLWIPGLAASFAGFVLSVLVIWPEWYRDEPTAKALAISAIYAFSFAHACLLSMPRLSRGTRWIFFSALAAIIALATLISAMIVFEIDDEWLFRFAGVLGILDGCATLTIPVLYKLGYKAPPIETPDLPGQPTLQIKLACPRCAHEATYPLGTITCTQCGLVLRVETVDSHDFPTGTIPGRSQFRLRSILIVFVVASLFLGWAATRLQYLRRQNSLVQRLTDRGFNADFRGGNLYNLSYRSNPSHRLLPGDIANLNEFPELVSLSLQGDQITDKHLRYLENLHHLISLTLDHTNVTDAGLAHLANLEGLTALNLLGTPITDAGLAPLTKLPNLCSLNLENTRVTDKGVQYLLQMPSLAYVTLTGTEVSESGVERLRNADIQVDFEPTTAATSQSPSADKTPQNDSASQK